MALLALAFALGATACGGGAPRAALDVDLTHRAGLAVTTDAGGRHFTDAGGRAVTLTRGWVVVTGVEIFLCPTVGERLWRLLRPVGVAWAHGVGSERKLAVPHASGLDRADGAPLPLGTLSPPPARYCRVRVTLGPADADAVGLPPAAAGVALVGKSLWLEGTVAPAGGGDPVPFQLTSAAESFVDLDEGGIDLAEGARATRRLAAGYGAWLDGLDPSAAGAGDALLRRIADGLALEAPP